MTSKSGVDVLSAANTGRAGGVYIAPHRRKQLEVPSDLSSEAAQKLSWEALRKSLNGLINKVSVQNIQNIVFEIFKENIYRGRGLLCRALMKSQAASPNFTAVYAALIAIINTKMPEIGELLLKRLIDQFRKSFRRNNKPSLIATVKFIAHLVNQRVCGVILPLQILALLLERPTDDSVEVAIAFIQEIGQRLQEETPQGFNSVFDRFRAILTEGQTESRVQFLIESLFAVRKSGFKDYPAIPEGLDLVEEEDQITHETLTLDEEFNIEEELNYFRYDPEFEENEKRYEELRQEILGEDENEEEEAGEEEAAAKPTQTIEDRTETDLMNLKRTVYLTVMSAIDFEEAATKLLKMNIKEGQEVHVARMIIECCMQERTYIRYYGLLAQRFCMLFRNYQDIFSELFAEQYNSIHRLETNKIRNVAKLFSHLLHTDAIPWSVLSVIKLTEKDTTSSSRIFIKILFQELAEYMGLPKLNKRLQDPDLQEYFTGIFPKDVARNTRFAINFFTLIGLGGLTDEMRAWLANAPKRAAVKQEESSSESSESSSDDSSSESSDESSSDESSSDESSGSSSDDESSSESSSESSRESSSSSESRSRRRSRSRSRTPPPKRRKV